MLDITILFSYLEKCRIKQSDLSKATGISSGNISDWKKGKSFPSAEKLVRISEYLNCSTDFLLGISDNPARVSSSLNTNESTIVELFRQLSDTQQGELIGRAKMMVEQNESVFRQEGAG